MEPHPLLKSVHMNTHVKVDQVEGVEVVDAARHVQRHAPPAPRPAKCALPSGAVDRGNLGEQVACRGEGCNSFLT